MRCDSIVTSRAWLARILGYCLEILEVELGEATICRFALRHVVVSRYGTFRCRGSLLLEFVIYDNIFIMKNIKTIRFPDGTAVETNLDERTLLRKTLGFRDLEILKDLPAESILGQRVMEVAETMKLS